MEKNGKDNDVQWDAPWLNQDTKTLLQVKMPYLSYKSHMRRVYGVELFSIPINLDFGCPNRDESGKGGCTFCPDHGARATQIADAQTVEEQMSKAMAFAKKRYHATQFSLYLQAYTSTFTSLLRQKKTYETLLQMHDFKAFHIGTRPDCLSEQTLLYLQSLHQKGDVIIELGV